MSRSQKQIHTIVFIYIIVIVCISIQFLFYLNNDYNITTTSIYDDKLYNMKENCVCCNNNPYTYIKMLLDELKSNNIQQNRKKTTSLDIYYHLLKCNNDEYLSNNERKQILVQIINGTIYTDLQTIKGRNNMYVVSIIIYLYHLMHKYGTDLPDTQFVWYFHDFRDYDKVGWLYNSTNWLLNNTVPTFWSDVDITNNKPYNNMFLFTVSRSYLKYKYYTDLLFINNSNELYIFRPYIVGAATNEYKTMDYKQFKEVQNDKVKGEILSWDNKQINKAFFRGRANNAKNRRIVMQHLLSNDTIFDTITRKYFDVMDYANMRSRQKQSLNLKFQRSKNLTQIKYLSMYEQLFYRYFICLDGISVRDALIFHLECGVIVLKQISTLYEWWYYDLINNYHLIMFDNANELIDIVITLAQNINSSIKHGKWNYNHLKRITQQAKKFIHKYILNEDNIDCFMLNMIKIYNQYLFNSQSMFDKTVMNKFNQFLYPIHSLIK